MNYISLILLTLYPALNIYLRNSEYVIANEFFECAAYSLIAAAVIILLAHFGNAKSGAEAKPLIPPLRLSILTLCLILFWLYNYLGLWVRGVCSVFGFNFALVNFFAFIFWFGFILLAYRRLIKAAPQNLKALSGCINIVSLALFAMSIFDGYNHYNKSKLTQAPQSETELKLNDISKANLPDLYFIVLDGYARADVLKDLYQLDNSEFLNFLKAQGFYIAEQSRSNYTQTVLSLTATLNLDYLDSSQLNLKLNSDFRGNLIEHLKNSRLKRFLQALGYQSVSIESGTNATSIREFDRYLSEFNSNVLAEILLSNINYPWIQSSISNYFYDRHAERIKFAFAKLPKLANLGQPLFVLAHIVSPHPPFVFGMHGQRKYPDKPYTIADGVSVIKNPYYQRDYKMQLSYLNSLVRTTVQQIVANKNRPAIIVIQGDHGPGSLLDWDNMNSASYRERFSILNAIYLPDQNYTALNSNLTPINTFRIILNNYFGQNLALPKDRNIFSTWDKPFEFKDISIN